MQHSTQAEKDANRAFLKFPTIESYVESPHNNWCWPRYTGPFQVANSIFSASKIEIEKQKRKVCPDGVSIFHREELLMKERVCIIVKEEKVKRAYEKYVKGALSESSIEKKIITAQHAVRFFCCLCVAIDPY